MILPTIEDYIEYIAGYIDINGNQIRWHADIKLNLASYDVGFVTSVADQIINRQLALSTKQAALAEKLIKTYEKQLAKHSVEQPNHKNYRYPLRDVVHVSSLTRENDMLYFRFPFNNTIIEDIKRFNKEAQGRVLWNKESKAWTFALTEFNVSWTVAYANSQKISIAPEVQELFNLILEVEKTPFSIELNIDENNKCYIMNAPESMKEYIDNNIGWDDIYALVDSSGVLGYTINKEIYDVMLEEHGPAFMKLCSAKNIDFVPNKTVIKSHSAAKIIEWSIKVDRLPIVVYNPNFLTPDITEYQKYFKDDEIKVVTLKDSGEYTTLVDSKTKVIYTNKIITDWDSRMPLLVTYANLMLGKTKKDFLNKAEKVVYFCEVLPRK